MYILKIQYGHGYTNDTFINFHSHFRNIRKRFDSAPGEIHSFVAFGKCDI